MERQKNRRCKGEKRSEHGGGRLIERDHRKRKGREDTMSF